MPPEVPLQPTIWRTCRVLANRRRLRLFQLVNQRPGRTVSEISRRARLPLSGTSHSLRALEARGLLTSQRRGRAVRYTTGDEGAKGVARSLMRALRRALQGSANTADSVFQLATAFTHPRRVSIFRALQAGPRSKSQLRSATGISAMALHRHIAKLSARGFVVACRTKGKLTYAVAKRSDALGMELARMAAS